LAEQNENFNGVVIDLFTDDPNQQQHKMQHKTHEDITEREF